MQKRCKTCKKAPILEKVEICFLCKNEELYFENGKFKGKPISKLI